MHWPSVTNARRGNVVNITSVAEGGGRLQLQPSPTFADCFSKYSPLERVVRTKNAVAVTLKRTQKMFMLSGCREIGSIWSRLVTVRGSDLDGPAWSQSGDLSSQLLHVHCVSKYKHGAGKLKPAGLGRFFSALEMPDY